MDLLGNGVTTELSGAGVASDFVIYFPSSVARGTEMAGGTEGELEIFSRRITCLPNEISFLDVNQSNAVHG